MELIRKIYDFLGRRVALIGGASVAMGLVMFGADLALAFSLQALFYSMNLLPDKPALFQDWIPYDNLVFVLTLFLVSGTGRGLVTWAQTYLTGIVIVDFESRIRSKLINWAFADRSVRVGAIADLFNDKTIGASNFISSLLNSVTRITVTVLLLGSLFGMSVEITALVLAGLAVLVLPLRHLNRQIRRDSENLHKDISSTLDRLLQGVRNSLLLHIHGTGAQEESHAQSSLHDYRQGYRRYYFFSGLKGVLPTLYGFWLICVIVFAALRIDTVEPAMLISYLYLFLRFVQSLGELANLGSYVTLTRPRMKVIWQWWETAGVALSTPMESVAPSIEHTHAKEVTRGPVGWALENVSLRYADNHATVISNLSLVIEPGSMLVVTGRSGSGKSSLLGLMLGLQAPSMGRVYVVSQDGTYTDLKDARSDLLELVGYVGPESFLIPGTIRENLNYGAHAPYSADDMRASLIKAECGFVFEFPEELEHQITEQGEGLSAGQKQRLSLARALLRNPKVLILDEATANLDYETEATLVETLRHLKGDITICAVSHREAMGLIADSDLNLDKVKAEGV